MPATEEIDTSFLQSLFSLPKQSQTDNPQNETKKPSLATQEPESQVATTTDDRAIVSQILDHISTGMKQTQPAQMPLASMHKPAKDSVPKQNHKNQRKKGGKNANQSYDKDEEATSAKSKMDDYDFDQLLNLHESEKAKPPQKRELDDMSLAKNAKSTLDHSRKRKNTYPVSNAKRHLAQQPHHQNQQQKKQQQQQQQRRQSGQRQSQQTCKHWKAGYCMDGDKCRYKHEGEQFIMVCRYFKSNSCSKGDSCPFSHELKIEPCRFYHVKGVCDAGDTCPFSHAALTPEGQKRLHSMTGPCRFYHFKGYCNDGDECVFSHGKISDEELKKLESTLEPCVFYHLRGGCSQGNDCFYLHDEISQETRQRLLQQQQHLVEQQQHQQQGQQRQWQGHISQHQHTTQNRPLFPHS